LKKEEEEMAVYFATHVLEGTTVIFSLKTMVYSIIDIHVQCM
jgi:hypothetical protein